MITWKINTRYYFSKDLFGLSILFWIANKHICFKTTGYPKYYSSQDYKLSYR